jgi:Arc/MetJ-type ribon-helix-helix transcriptional regulator
MPRYRVEFLDGHTHEGEYPNGDLAKRAAKTEAQQKSGAIARTDPAVKVKAVTDLDAERPAGRDPAAPPGPARPDAARRDLPPGTRVEDQPRATPAERTPSQDEEFERRVREEVERRGRESGGR